MSLSESFLAILLSTGIAFYFELKSEKEFELLSQVGDEVRYKVMRDGEIIQIPKREIVVGDLLYLETGEEIPADAELLEAVTLSVDESTLTGEPMTTKSIRPEDQDSEATYPTNYICRGTTILEDMPSVAYRSSEMRPNRGRSSRAFR